MTTREILIRCFYDGMTLDEAINFATTAYNCNVTKRIISNVKKYLKEKVGKEWS